ncbi:hypothetical protein BDR26DRAFT_1011161 [Obelidium mucronatum]|nr:hypothetical protein BDR26DRAFT_1011161 [Obelidium mucronatum]
MDLEVPQPQEPAALLPEQPQQQPEPAAPLIFESHVAFRVVEFTTQTSPPVKAPIAIFSSSIEDFHSKLFAAVRPHLKKKALVDTSTTPYGYSWDPRGENVDVTMLGDYLQFHDTVGKKKIHLSKVDTATLVSWRTKFPSTNPIVIIVASNSHTIASAPIHKEFIKALGSRTAVDRAGADTEEVLNDMIRRLREHYQSIYTSAHVNWRIWASLLLQGDIQNLEERFLRGPDPSIIHLFATAGVAHEYQNHQIVLSNNVAIQENQRSGARLESMRVVLNQVAALIKDMDTRLTAAEEENKQQCTVLTDMQTALRPVEPQAARSVFHQITNQLDIDHGVSSVNVGGSNTGNNANRRNNGQ